MMLPILISVSVAPVSYFFWASAVLLVAARITRAAEIAPNRKWNAGILISLDQDSMCLFEREHFAAPLRIEYPPKITSNKKALCVGSQRASFSRTLLGHIA